MQNNFAHTLSALYGVIHTCMLRFNKCYGQDRVKVYLFKTLCKLADTILHALYSKWVHLSFIVLRAMGKIQAKSCHIDWQLRSTSKSY